MERSEWQFSEEERCPYQCVCGERFVKPGQLGNHCRYNDGHYPRRKWDDQDTFSRICTRMKAKMVRMPGVGLVESTTGAEIDRPIVTPPATENSPAIVQDIATGIVWLRSTLFDKPAESAVGTIALLLGIQFLCAPEAVGKAILTLIATAYGVEVGGLVGATSKVTLGNSLPKRYRDLASSKRIRDDIHYFIGMLVTGVVLRYLNMEYALTARLGVEQYLPGCTDSLLPVPDVVRAFL
jgi:hypothetical protein